MSVPAINYEIWACGEDKVPDPDGAHFKEHVDTYLTREGALAKARVLLKQGRSVEIVPVSKEAKR